LIDELLVAFSRSKQRVVRLIAYEDIWFSWLFTACLLYGQTVGCGIDNTPDCMCV
jgi:hypothetical protein